MAQLPPTSRSAPANNASNVLHSSLSQATSSKTAEGRRKSGAALAQEVRIFRYLCRQRSKQYSDLRTRMCDMEAEAEEADMELVYALDRAEFSQAQLQKLVNASPTTNASEFLFLIQEAELKLRNHIRAQEEMQDRREHVARILSYLRILRTLCSVREISGLGIDQGLAEVFRQCEAKLVETWNNDAELEQLASEFYELSPLHTLLPLIANARRSGEESAVPPPTGQDQWLLPAQRTSSSRNVAEEDARLHHEVAQLTDRNEVLRLELTEEAAQQDFLETEERGAKEAEDQAARESELWQDEAHTKLAEAEELRSEVAGLQAKLSQMESEAAAARRQLGCERSTVSKQSEEISRFRTDVSGLTRQLRQIVPADANSHERQANLLHLRKELAEAYDALAAQEVLDCSAYNAEVVEDVAESCHEQGEESNVGSPGEIGHLERKLQVQKAINIGLKQAVEARNGSVRYQAKQMESRNELLLKVARNSKEIASLKDQVRNAELQEGVSVIRRQESRVGGQPLPSPGQSSRGSSASVAPNHPAAIVQTLAEVKTTDMLVKPQVVPATISRIVSTASGTSRKPSKDKPDMKLCQSPRPARQLS